MYDSLYRKIPKSGRQKFLTSVAMLLNTSTPNMTIQWVDMKKQKGSSDCGLFAIASAASLCNGQDPSAQAFDQSVMRAHLALCFDCEEISHFPVTSRHGGGSVEEHIRLFCHCRMPYNEGIFMVECSRCQG